jgi:hypothetical protein
MDVGCSIITFSILLHRQRSNASQAYRVNCGEVMSTLFWSRIEKENALILRCPTDFHVDKLQEIIFCFSMIEGLKNKGAAELDSESNNGSFYTPNLC